ncbi:hypothetical protein [uncultured Algibacter sp.]|uniref:hypothetical protein n=1 Tax=uncultured Algibacter sp. TaxID=298659 RepID=UPI0026178CA3|nr:hypothetical protein [uncultured Algibacter sp.]
MKTIFLLFSILLINQDCSTKLNQIETSIIYTESSRAYYFQVIVENDIISIIKQRGANPVVKSCPEALKNALLLELNKLDIKQLQNFEPPSVNHQFDGAHIANLQVIKNNKTYQSKNFDHNNPPTEIVTIVKEILSIVENIE